MSSKKKGSAPKPVPVKQEPPRLLGRNGGTVQDPRYALGANARYTTAPPAILSDDTEEELRRIKETEQPPEPERVDKETEKWITEEARERFNMTLELEQKAERILYLRRRLEKKAKRSIRRAA